MVDYSFSEICIKEYSLMAYKNKNIVRQGPFFTHFATLPFISPEHRRTVQQIQQQVRKLIHSHPRYQQPDFLKEHHHNQCHLTLFKLVLRHEQTRQRMIAFMNQHQSFIKSALAGITVRVENINYFTRLNKNQKCREIIVIYAEIDEKSKDQLIKMTDTLMRGLLKQQIIVSSELKDMNVVYDHNNNLYKPETLHMSLFRARNLLEDQKVIDIFKEIQINFKSFEAHCHYFDISTMGKQYDQTEFYLPLHRIQLKEEKIEKEQEERIEKEKEENTEAKIDVKQQTSQ